jgi:hypothetical protein
MQMNYSLHPFFPLCIQEILAGILLNYIVRNKLFGLNRNTNVLLFDFGN